MILALSVRCIPQHVLLMRIGHTGSKDARLWSLQLIITLLQLLLRNLFLSEAVKAVEYMQRLLGVQGKPLCGTLVDAVANYSQSRYD